MVVPLVGLDRDAQALEIARGRLAEFGDKVTLVHANFSQIGEVFAERRASSRRRRAGGPGCIEHAAGFGRARFFHSGAKEPTGHACMDRSSDETASDIVNTADEKALADLLCSTGGRAGFTQDRQDDSSRASHTGHRTPGNGCGRGPKRKGKAEAASRDKNVSGAADCGESRDGETSGSFFQGFLPHYLPGGRWVMLSYHSLEDRPVKQCFQRLAHEGVLRILTKKVIQASDAEIAANPRARSVKMRVAGKIRLPTSRSRRKRKSGCNDRVLYRKAN